MASYTLHIQYVDRPAETRTISQPKITIGRDAGDIVLHDSQVSGRHAEITWDGTTLKFTDLGSTNGSFLLQGQRVANLELTPGIALRVGNSLITVQAIDGAASAAGKGRTMIAGPGMVPGFPAPMKNAPPRPPGPGPIAPPSPPAPGNFAFAPTAQHQGPMLRPAPQPGGPPGALGGLPFAPAPPQPMPAPMPAPMPPAPAPMAAPPMAGPPAPVPMPAAPAPIPPPQPPGPPPGSLAGTPQSAVPTPAPMAPAAPAPAPEPVLMPEIAAPVAPATPVAAPASAPEGDLGAQIKHILGQGWAVLQPVAAPAIATVAAVLIPIGLLAQLGLMILPLSLAGLLATLLALVQLAAMVILYPSLARFLLGSYLGQPVPIQAVVQQSIHKAADVAVNCFVPGIPLGIFAAPIYYVEDKKLGAVIGRNFNLLGKELVPILVSILAGGFALGLGMAIVGYILGLLPFGGIINSIFVNGVMSFMVAYGAALSVSLYFSVRRKHEGGDPEGEARARLGAATTALPGA